MTARRLAVACTCLLLVAPLAAAGRVVLKGGYEVLGDVLKEDGEVVIVDIGAEVLRIPRERVVEVTAAGGAETRPATATAPVVEKRGAKWQLYRTADLPRTTIEDATRRFGEAVVMVSTPGGLGSGFVISPDGYLITNYHVIARETRIKVTVFHRTDKGFEQQDYRKVEIIAINPFVDLALLKIAEPEEDLEYVFLGEMSDVEAGQQVFAIGNPLGLTRTVSQGIVSTKNRNFEGRLYIQTTTDINPGNSGGPLFNIHGEVIGVTSMGYIYFGGLNFAIPVDVVKRFVVNRDAFAYDEDNPNAGYRYLQPGPRERDGRPPEVAPPTPGNGDADADPAGARRQDDQDTPAGEIG